MEVIIMKVVFFFTSVQIFFYLFLSLFSNEWNFLDDMSVSSLEIPSDSFVNELLENTED